MFKTAILAIIIIIILKYFSILAFKEEESCTAC